jgi:hypothetical protein
MPSNAGSNWIAQRPLCRVCRKRGVSEDSSARADGDSILKPHQPSRPPGRPAGSPVHRFTGPSLQSAELKPWIKQADEQRRAQRTCLSSLWGHIVKSSNLELH